MKKSEFETMLTIGIAAHRLALLREVGNRDLFYSGVMHDVKDSSKIYLVELFSDYFILRSDLIFDECVEHFFYVTKEKFEYSEDNAKNMFMVLRKTEHRVHDILSKLHLRGFYTRRNFLSRLMMLMPQLEFNGDFVKDKRSGKIFMIVKEDHLHFTYKDGKTESFMDLVNKDFNEHVLQQCVEMIKISLGDEK